MYTYNIPVDLFNKEGKKVEAGFKINAENQLVALKKIKAKLLFDERLQNLFTHYKIVEEGIYCDQEDEILDLIANELDFPKEIIHDSKDFYIHKKYGSDDILQKENKIDFEGKNTINCVNGRVIDEIEKVYIDSIKKSLTIKIHLYSCRDENHLLLTNLRNGTFTQIFNNECGESLSRTITGINYVGQSYSSELNDNPESILYMFELTKELGVFETLKEEDLVTRIH